MWAQIGLSERQTFADDRHLVIYGQRTADGRIAFGGRGAPYGYRSRIDPAIEQRSRMHDRIIRCPRRAPAHARRRRHHSSVGRRARRTSRLVPVGRIRPSPAGWPGRAATSEKVRRPSNLAGRTLADLITGTDSPRFDLPWVGHRSRNWEPEPLRWLAINGALLVMESADRSESRSNRDSMLARWMWKLMR